MNKEDARYHRFLWETPERQVGVFEMTGVVFGDSPSPCQAIYTLWRTVEEYGDPTTLDMVKNSFYMDDFLTSFQSAERAEAVKNNLCSVLKNGNFNLTKWRSNVLDIMDGEIHGEDTLRKNNLF
jgi:hypothetical protein